MGSDLITVTATLSRDTRSAHVSGRLNTESLVMSVMCKHALIYLMFSDLQEQSPQESKDVVSTVLLLFVGLLGCNSTPCVCTLNTDNYKVNPSAAI